MGVLKYYAHRSGLVPRFRQALREIWTFGGYRVFVNETNETVLGGFSKLD